MPPGKHILLVVILVCVCGLPGCRKTAPPAKTSAKTNKAEAAKPAQADFPKLLPAETYLYVRVDDVQRARDEFIDSKFVKDAKTARPAWLTLLNDLLKAVQTFENVPLGQVWKLAAEVKSIHLGAFPAADSQQSVPEFVGFLEVADSTALDDLQNALSENVKTESIGGKDVRFLKGPYQIAFYRPTPSSVAIGTQSSIRTLLERAANEQYRTLADSSRFQQALRDFGSHGELFTFADVEKLRPTGLTVPIEHVSHLAATIGVDGGFALRAYAAEGKTLPGRLVRTSRKKELLRKLPRETAILLSSSFDADQVQRNQFAAWVTQLVDTDDILKASAIPHGVRTLAKSFFNKTGGVEAELADILKDLFFGTGPVKSESAIFVAPNSQGQWGAAAFFDAGAAESIDEFKQRLQKLAARVNLKWQTETVDGVTIHSLNLSKLIAGSDPQPVPEAVEKLLQLRIGYAETKDHFVAGSVDLIRFILKPAEKILANEFNYEHLDEANAMMFSIRPGRILNRKFGFKPVDTVLEKLATQIPIDSNYTLTLSLESKQATLKSNIPFISLVGWLVLEWKGKGPARLNETPAADRPMPNKKP